MNLYLLTRKDELTYDEYDSCVVCAETEEDAKTIHPDGTVFKGDERPWRTWVGNSSEIDCELIGIANENQERGVILASFNAG